MPGDEIPFCFRALRDVPELGFKAGMLHTLHWSTLMLAPAGTVTELWRRLSDGSLSLHESPAIPLDLLMRAVDAAASDLRILDDARCAAAQRLSGRHRLRLVS